MRRVLALVAALTLLGACGGKTHTVKELSPTPSFSAKMICETEVAGDLYAQATGVRTIAPLKPSWTDHVYACSYVYPHGAVMRLSVEDDGATAATSYFDTLASRLHKTQPLTMGDAAFQVADGSVVMRKDDKVLLVDVSKLPAQFGKPPASRGDFAVNVTEVILQCWTGA